MRSLLVSIALAMTAAPSHAQSFTGVEWQVLAIDGKRTDMPATLRLEENGAVTGHAPCNGYGSRNMATLPELRLQGIRATKRACDRLAEESLFLNALSAMTRVELDGPKNLILSGPDGRSMEFSLASVSSLPECKTCAPKD